MKVWFIRHEGTYLGVTIWGTSGAEFSNDYAARLNKRGPPLAFATEDEAIKALTEDTPGYNSSIDTPMRGDGWGKVQFSLDNCEVVGVELP